MKSLCSNSQQRTHLLKLVKMIQQKTLTGPQAWSALSDPKPSKSFKLKNGTFQEIQFSLAERNTYKVLRETTQKTLFAKHGRMCSYCRRPVGHYGYSWHIEHVLPKSLYPSLTFRLANLTIGCVDCNRWKGVRVDKHIKRKSLLIINPIESDFIYSAHLRYFQVSTEYLSFAKYLPQSQIGIKTYEQLSFAELERVHAINHLDGLSSALHERITRAMSIGLIEPEGQEFLALLGNLKSSIYRGRI